ncbi:MAG: hypothetical protein JW730_07055 [Anaerolineales bacterium]|nr:hypothetical protein [Anaerolineales bacterium]
MYEYIAILLIAILCLILTLYNRRMAAAIRGIESIVQDYYAMQIRARRADQMKEIDASSFNALQWIGAQASSGLDRQVEVTEVLRLVPEASAIDLRTADNRRLVVSPLPLPELLRFDKRLRSNGGKSASVSRRVEAFASRPLLNQSRWGWGVTVVERALSEAAEFFDLEAHAAGTRLGIDWRAPARLWFYVVD